MIYINFFIIFIIILVILYYFLSNKNKSNNNKSNNNKSNNNKLNNNKLNNITYYKSKNYPIVNILKNILSNHKFIRTTKLHNCNLYLPNNYTFVEDELKSLTTKNNNYIFALDGCDLLAGKNNIWELLEKTYGRKITIKLMPETWILDNKAHIQLIKNNYVKNKIYILKKNIQRKNGILLTNDYNEIIKNIDSDFIVAQNYIKNTLLINNRKLNLRVYLLIINKNNKIHSYLYKNGKCIYTNKDYKYSLDMEENITSLNLDNSIYNINPLTLFELQDYFKKKNIDYNTIFNKICLNIKYLHHSYKNKIGTLNKFKNNTRFQLFGLDYIITSNLDILLLEINKGPSMSSINSKDYNLKYKLFQDMFETVGLLENTSKKKNLFLKIP